LLGTAGHSSVDALGTEAIHHLSLAPPRYLPRVTASQTAEYECGVNL
jgi:hypothetical protein